MRIVASTCVVQPPRRRHRHRIRAYTRAYYILLLFLLLWRSRDEKKKISVFIRFIIFNKETSKWHRRSVWRSADDVEGLIRLDVITPSACAYVYNIIYMMITYTSNIQYIHNMYTLIVIYANPKRNPFFSFPRVVKYSNIMLIAV